MLAGHPRDPSWTASRKWTDEYLIRTAGDTPIKVEVRRDRSDQFGRDNKIEMTFAEFVRRVASGDDSLYLTTQAVKAAPDGFPELHAGPVTRLAGDFPVVPALLGELVPQNINLWMGAAPDGASSGLHHDFHDNLYVLLRGRKRFRLYSPELAPRMYTHGRLNCIHHNGRIVYHGDGDIRADGADVDDALAWESRHCNGHQPSGDDEDELDSEDEALEEALDSAVAGSAALEDDYVDSDDGSHQESDDPSGSTAGEPPSFSRVDLQKSDADIAAAFPQFPGRKAAVVAELHAGDSLFLPAGWFHEVTSSSPPQGGGHLALNYWLHPPDVQLRGPAAAAAPYRHPMWPKLWQQRQRRAGHPSTTTTSCPCKADEPLSLGMTAVTASPGTAVVRDSNPTRPQKSKRKMLRAREDEVAVGFGGGGWFPDESGLNDDGGGFDAEEAGLDALMLVDRPIATIESRERKKRRRR